MTFQDRAEAEAAALQREPPLPPKPRVRYRGRVSGRYGKGGKERGATVTIDRAGTFHVRPFNSPKLRSMPLARVAMWVFTQLAAAEGRANRIKRAPKWNARRAGAKRRR